MISFLALRNCFPEEDGTTVQRSTARQSLEEAHADAVRTASRTSMLGALGFGVALLVGLRLADQGGFFMRGFGLDMLLLAGGVSGGIVFTFLALRASRLARAYRRHLDEEDLLKES